MKIVIITPVIPYPLSEGGKVSQFAIIDSLRKLQQISLILLVYQPYEFEYVSALKHLWSDVDVNAIDLIEESTLNKNTYDKFINLIGKVNKRIYHKIESILKSGTRNLGNTKNSVGDSSFRNLYITKSKYVINEIDKVISKIKPDIVQVEFLDFVDIGFAIAKDVKKVFVHHEIRFVRLKRHFSTTKESVSAYANYLTSLTTAQEINLLSNYDSVFVFCDEDKKELANYLPTDKVNITPFPVIDKYFQDIDQNEMRFDKLVFVGGEEHFPNKDAVEWYINEIATKVAEKCDIVLHITGIWTEKTKEQYRKNKHILFVNYVDDLITYCKNSIALVPVRIGSGIRTKILYSMAQGIPVISTSIGIEGIKVEKDEDVLIANTPTEFAEQISFLFNNSNAAIKLATNAQNKMKSNYSQGMVVAKRIELYKNILNDKN